MRYKSDGWKMDGRSKGWKMEMDGLTFFLVFLVFLKVDDIPTFIRNEIHVGWIDAGWKMDGRNGRWRSIILNF